MVIWNLGPVNVTSSPDGDLKIIWIGAGNQLTYEHSAMAGREGINTYIMTDKKTGDRYIASINVRLELSDDIQYQAPSLLSKEGRDRENYLSEIAGLEDMGEDFT